MMALLYGLDTVEYCVGEIISFVCFGHVRRWLGGSWLNICPSANIASCLAGIFPKPIYSAARAPTEAGVLFPRYYTGFVPT